MAKQPEDSGVKWELLVADAWADPDLKKRLLANPAAVLKERGIQAPEGKEIKILEETEGTWYLVIPEQPVESELSEEELEGVAGGFPCVQVTMCRPCGGWGGCGGWGPPPPPCRGCGGWGPPPPPCRGCGGWPPPPPPCRP